MIDAILRKKEDWKISEEEQYQDYWRSLNQLSMPSQLEADSFFATTY